MASSIDDAVLDFDLNLFRHTPTIILDPSQIEKQRKAICQVKKKIVSIDSVINRHYVLKEALDDAQKMLAVSKEECKKTCIDYKNAMEKCTRLEREYEQIRLRNEELERQTFTKDNEEAAKKSYLKQLQLLLKARESSIQSLQNENKFLKTSAKEREKRSLKEKTYMKKCLTNIANLVFLKKPLPKKDKMFLYKFFKNNKSEETIEEIISERESSDGEEVDDGSAADDGDFVESTTDKDASCDATPIIEQEPTLKADRKDDTDQESDILSEAVSLDTGRGSSLAYSDKCYPSPDYFADSPVSSETFKVKKQADSSTSPITILPTIETGTSPIVFDVEIEDNSSEDVVEIDMPPIAITNSIPKVLVDRAVSPIIIPEQQSGDEEHDEEVVTAETCLQKNNSNVLNVNENDGEIEMILGTMRLSHHLVTPIPPTPAGSLISKSRLSKTTEEHDTCPVAAQLLEENKVMQTSIADLAKEMVNLKLILKKHFVHVNNNGDEATALTDEREDRILLTSNVHNDRSKLDDIIEQFENNRPPSDHSDSGDDCRLVIEEEPHRQSLVPMVEKEQLEKSSKETSPIKDHSATRELRVSISPIPVSSFITFEGNESVAGEEEEDDDPISLYKDTNMEMELISPSRKRGVKKSSRLEKLRKNILPKSKIRKVDQPISQKLRARLKKFPINDKNGKNMISANPVDNKEAYEKAVKVMSEFRSKQEAKAAKIPKIRKGISSRKSEPSTKNNRNKEHEQGTESSTTLKNNNRVYLRSGSHTENNSNETKEQEIETAKTPKNDKRVYLRSEPAAKNNKEIKNQKLTDSYDRDEVADVAEKSSVSTRSRAARLSCDKDLAVVVSRSELEQNRSLRKSTDTEPASANTEISPRKNRKRLKRFSRDTPSPLPTRVLRSFARADAPLNSEKSEIEKTNKENGKEGNRRSARIKSIEENASVEATDPPQLTSYKDLELFSDDECPKKKRKCQENETCTPGIIQNPQDSVLCKMIDKYGITAIKQTRKIPDAIVKVVGKKLEDGIAHINELPASETKKAMNDLVEDLQKYKLKDFVSGLMIYMNDPQRKIEWFNKVHAPPAPPMTKSEQVLLYIVTRLNWPDVNLIDCVLNQIEHTLFKLHCTPEFRVIETMSHFYAILCSYIKAKSRLRLFILDAMYCIHFKAIPLVRQCIEVWMHILPLSHMGIAKNPLVVSLVYLLFFFKCEDKFNRVQEIRNILTQKYFFKITEWNESKILEMLKNAIKEVKDNPMEKKMLRLALILIAKRNSPRWCQTKIIQNILQPLIMQSDVPERVKVFSVSMLGPLMKPYPADMKVHCEIVMNQLIDMLDQDCSTRMRETIFSSLINMSRHNSNRVVQTLLAWRAPQLSAALEAELRGFVRSRPLRAWRAYLSKIPLIQ